MIDLPLLTLQEDSKVPKYRQVVNAVTDAILRGKLKKGQRILSINELSEEFPVSRVTVEKAYAVLKEEGIIIPIKGKGFYINNVDIDIPLKVLLLFNKISDYKRQIYNSFLQTLSPDAQVDLKIHHFNHRLLKSYIENHINDYDYFVLMPYFYENEEAAIATIKSIPSEKLILLDRKHPFLSNQCATVYQDFENDIINALEEGSDLLAKYNKLNFVNSTHIPYPPEMLKGFKKFCMQNQICNEVTQGISVNARVQKGEAYIVIEEMDLANLIKICMDKGLTVGKDVGIVSYNETPLKELLLGGITVLTTDHAAMGKAAAELILQNRVDSIRVPFKLIRRKSL